MRCEIAASLLGGGGGGGIGLSFAGGVWAEDDKKRDCPGNDAGDDDQQDRAAEGLPFLRRRGGGGSYVHWMQDAKVLRIILLRGEWVFFLGFLQKEGVWTWFFDGVIVVE